MTTTKRPLPNVPSMGLSLSGIDRDTWLALRETGIGGSEAAAVLGCSPWAGPYNVWLNKTGRGSELPETSYMEWGNRLEAAILQAFEEKSGIRCQPTAFCRHPTNTFMTATPDAFAMSDDGRFRAGIVEIKTANAFASHKWGQDGSTVSSAEGSTGVCPINYYWQVAHNMAVCDLDRGYLAVLIGGNDFRWYKIKRNREDEAHLVGTLGRFWTDYVATDTPPTIDDTPACRSYMDSMYSEDDGTLLPEKEEINKIVLDLLSAYDNVESAESNRELLRNRLRDAIGKAAGVQTCLGVFTYKATRNGQMRLNAPKGWREKS